MAPTEMIGQTNGSCSPNSKPGTSDPNFESDLEAAPLKLKHGDGNSAATPLMDERKVMGLPIATFSGAAYCFASGGMVLLNKAALSSFSFDAPTCLLFFQCTVCVLLVRLASQFGLVKLEPWSWKIAKAWFPVNVIFVGMIWSSFLALKNLGVPMATVLKNLTILITISGDYVFYGRTYGCGVWSSMGLVVLSAICGAATDMAFDVYGYVWQLINCFFTAAYSLYLRGVMDKVVMLTQSQTKMNEFSMVFYNNFLSLPVLAVLIVYQGELKGLQDDAGLRNPRFILAAMASALAAFGISFASLWFLSCTTATTYGLVGSLNKVPIAFLGLIAFHVPANAQNMLSVLLGLIAGILFVNAKQTSGK